MEHVFVWTIKDIVAILLLGIALFLIIYSVLEYYIKKLYKKFKNKKP